MLTKVMLSGREVKIHSTVVGLLKAIHSTRIFLFGSIAITFTSVDDLYISHSQRICLPVSNFPLLLVNQNLVVMSGLMNASNTSATGLRINISAFAIINISLFSIRDDAKRFVVYLFHKLSYFLRYFKSSSLLINSRAFSFIFSSFTAGAS